MADTRIELRSPLYTGHLQVDRTATRVSAFSSLHASGAIGAAAQIFTERRAVGLSRAAGSSTLPVGLRLLFAVLHSHRCSDALASCSGDGCEVRIAFSRSSRVEHVRAPEPKWIK